MAEEADITLLVWTLVGIGVVLAIHVIGELVSKKKTFSEHIVAWESAGAGIFVGGFFLEVLPNIITSEAALGKWVFLIFLISTVVVHLVEKELFKYAVRHYVRHNPNDPHHSEHRPGEHHHPQPETRASLQELAKKPRDRRLIFEAAALSVHGLLIGAIMPELIERHEIYAFFYIVPFVVHWFTVAACTDHLDYALHSKVEHLVRDISPLVGSIIGFLIIHNAVSYSIYMTILIGAITYIMVRDFLPRSDKGKPLYFIIGIAIMVTFFLIFTIILEHS